MSSPHPPARPKHKQPPAGLGIAAGAEDAKYQAKYKELKRKVRDIEADNDKLHFKVLQAKLSIRRMKMERAILYERLAVVPPSPPPHDRQPLPQHAPIQQPHHPASRPPSVAHHKDHAYPQPPRAGPDPALLSPHTSVHSPRRVPSSSTHDPIQHIQNMAPMPIAHHHHQQPPPPPHPQQQQQQHPPYAHPVAASPPLHARTRSHSSSSRSHHHHQQQQQQALQPPPSYRGAPPPASHHYAESLPPPTPAGQHLPMHSPPLSDRERSGRTHESVDSHAGHSSYDRTPHTPLSPPARGHHSAAIEPRRVETQRVHPHQRHGPGTYITRDFDDSKHRERDLEREREWEREWELRERERDHRDHRETREHRNRERDRDREWELREHERRSEYGAPPPSSHSGGGAVHHHIRSPHGPPARVERGDYDPHAPPRSRDRERERDRSDQHGSYYHEHRDTHGTPSGGAYPPPPPPQRLSRSDTPGSASASGSGAPDAPPSRPDSRSQAYYDRERELELHERGQERHRRSSSSYRLRPVGGSGSVDDVEMEGRDQRDREYAHESEHYRAYPPSAPSMGPTPAPSGQPLDREATPAGNGVVSRKRTRAEMDVDSGDEGGRYAPGADYTSNARHHPMHTQSQSADDGGERSGKRYHRDRDSGSSARRSGEATPVSLSHEETTRVPSGSAS